MIIRITGWAREVEGQAVSIEIEGSGVWREVLVPTYLLGTMRLKVGEQVTLHTLEYLEGQGQGSSFIPRLIGFATMDERRFFEVFTSAKGIGNRRALRALAEPPSVVARAIASRNVDALRKLPEIGPRTAESLIAELKGKVDGFAMEGTAPMARAVEIKDAGLPGGAGDAIEALVHLGETRVEAERLVRKVIDRGVGHSADEILAAVLGARGR